MPIEIIMPQLGDSVSEGTISKWLKREGDQINEYDPLLEVSGDKIDTEIPAPQSGILVKILIPVGEKVLPGACLGLLEDVAETPSPLAPLPQGEGNKHASNGDGQSNFVSPVVARMVAEHDLNLAVIAGSGRGGRVTKKDVEAYLEQQQHGDERAFLHRSAPAPEEEAPQLIARGNSAPPRNTPPPFNGAARRVHPVEDIPQGVAGELVPLTAMRKTIAEHMVNSKLHTAPHVTTVFEFDLSAVLAHREAHKEAFARQGVNLTLTAYFAAATVQALQANRYLNAQWTDEGIYLHNAVNLGIAVALDEGLIVPVIKNAGGLNLLGLAQAINDLATRARSKQLKADEIKGGTFTITNHGVSGSLLATPIINQPQVGILGVGVMEKRVKVIDDMIAIRPCCYMTLTFDHRVADGAVGDAFMLTLKQAIEGWS
ncbi:MAG: dihydrolipoamide acetyltransferase family protein [Anaerolineae bacterium]